MLGHRALGEGSLSALLQGQVTVTEEVTLRFASHSFVTRATDSPAHEFIEGRIARGVTLGRQLNTAEGGQFGALFESGTGPNLGEIQLLNLDGQLDSYVTEYFADGRPIRLKIGATEITTVGRERVKAYATFATVYTAIAGEWQFEHDIVRLRIRNQGDRLKSRLQLLTYPGNGGKNGTADIAGRTLPTCFGYSDNITPQLVDPTILTYQVHSTRINAVRAVYDAGISVPVSNDYATYANLASATIPAGTHATCLMEGFFRLATIPVGAVTADISGHVVDPGAIYHDTHGAIMELMLLEFSDLSEADLDTDSFDVLDAANGDSMGIYFPAGDQSTVEEAIERVAFSVGAFVGQDRTGLMRTKRITVPTGNADWSFDDRDIISIERESLPYVVPWKSWGVGYAVNWTVQTDADLASGVAQSRRQFLESDRRYAYVQSPTIATAHRTSAGAPLRQSLFVNQASAAAEAQRLIELYSLGRALYRVQVKNALFSVEIGQTVRLSYDRWDLAGGKSFIVMGIDDDADSVSTELLLFG